MASFIALVQLMYFVQLLHSVEELTNGFHEKWFFMKLSYRFFLTFEIFHNLFWASVILVPVFPLRMPLLALFTLLMFANGVEHVVWAMWKRKYVPGLVTAMFHVALFCVYFISGVEHLFK